MTVTGLTKTAKLKKKQSDHETAYITFNVG